MIVSLTPHPIPPHEGEGAAFGWRLREISREWKAALAVDVKAPPLPRVGRGWGWGALGMCPT